MRIEIWQDLTAEGRRAVLARPALANDASVAERVAAIIERVRNEGDAALLDLTAKLDRVQLVSIEVGQAELAARGRPVRATTQRDAIRAAAANIEAFHEPQLPAPLAVDTAPGVRCERVSRPIESVGLYVPAGNAPLPSTALMLGVPARLAACPTRILCTPPQADGGADPAVLYAALVSGVQRVFKLGGAQAIAALAYGTETVPKVDKVFGPGSVWVTEAKAQVDRDPYGAARDYPAGPSEVLVIADASADPAFVAADLLSQAEHGADSQVLLLTIERGSRVGRRRAGGEPEGDAAAAPDRRGRARPLARHRRRRPRRGVRDLQPVRAGALDPADRASARLVAACARGRLRVPRPMDARDRRRLLQRHEPRAADLRLRAPLFEPRRRRFSPLA